jgi:UDPglucose 6-dehydrogenase
VATTPVGAARSADALVILTDWKDFTECDLGELADYMADPVMVDLRNLFDEDAVRESGFRQYVRIGRKTLGGHRTPAIERRAQRTRTPLVVPPNVARHDARAEVPSTVEAIEAV